MSNPEVALRETNGPVDLAIDHLDGLPLGGLTAKQKRFRQRSGAADLE